MKKIFVFLFTFIYLSNVSAQVSNYVSRVRMSDALEKTQLNISADLYNVENISQISVVYKPFGETEFKLVEMQISGTQANGSISSDEVVPPYLEYYLLIELKNGSKQTFPLGIEEGVLPLQIVVSSKSEKGKGIIVLSPEEGEVFTKDDFLISVSFVRSGDNIDITKTKLLLNNVDITSKALIDNELIVITNEQLNDFNFTENNQLEIKIYDKENKLVSSVLRNFKYVNKLIASKIQNQFSYNGQIKAEARNENTFSNQIFYKNLLVDFNSSYSDWKINLNAYFTSEEKENLQPFNRYSFSIQNENLLSIKVGDAFPKFSNLILDGKRVRGLTGELNLGFFNIQTSFGEIFRSIEGKLLQTYNANNVPLSNDVISINPLKYKAPFGKVIFGTYKRELFAIRPSFGSGKNFQLGFTYLHGIDNINSIEFGARPKENVVLGTDLKLSLDNNNILFTTNAAFSLINKDISTGTLTDAQIDSIFTSNKDLNINPSDVKKIRDLIDKFITVNQYLGPWNPQKFASLGSETVLSLNYLNNTFRASYIYRGNEYQSFGQSFLRTDIKGINLTDRIRMLDNKLFFSFGFENLEDNLQNTKLTTTKFQTISASVSYFPRMDFPNITFGYSNNHNKNGFDYKDLTFGKYAIDETIKRLSLILSYDIYYLVKHSTSFSFSNSIREVKSSLNTDSKSSNISFNVNSYWYKNLISNVGFVYNNLDLFGNPFNYFSVSIGGRYILLDDKLSLYGNVSPSFGDFKRQSFEFVANYNVMNNFVIIFQTRIFRIPNQSTNSIVGLSTRLNI
ncbi:MAG: hypothetical protein N2321_07465 [Melioribacteraceae bacterium]|nr:hypothetical protein [Melioribacteraceae bacterium]